MRIYHIKHVGNLAAVAAAGEILATNALRGGGIRYASIAHANIQERRASTPVPVGPRGTLHDYVPFYFAPRPPMLYTIHRGNVAGSVEGQNPIVHLVADTEAAAAAGRRCVFTDGHAAMAFTRFFEDFRDDAARREVDWELMRSPYWNDTADDPDRKRRRQAEFLVYGSVPWPLVRGIGVIDEAMRRRTEAALAGAAYAPPVRVLRGWYY